MELNYELVGKRIKDIRIGKNLTQENLAELTEFSPSHIGHIERADTKLSIAALVDIANALEVTTDQILADVVYQSSELLADDFANLLKDCNSNEMYVILQIAQAAKDAMRVKKLSNSHP